MNSEDRERLINAVLHFSSSWGKCTAKRLFVSLYILDVLHFQQTGRSVTGLEHAAGTFGPYAHALAEELEGYLRPDLAKLVSIEHVPGLARNDLIHANRDQAPIAQLFSPREQRLMGAVVAIVQSSASLIAAVTATDAGAWGRALSRGKHSVIRLEDAVPVDAQNRETILAQATLHRARDNRLRSLAA